MVNGPALVLRGLRKVYKDVVAVDGLDLEVRPGSWASTGPIRTVVTFAIARKMFRWQ